MTETKRSWCSESWCKKWPQFGGKCIEHAKVPHILDEGHMTHKEIAEVMGITRSAVWQIERRALLKLRRECKRRGINLVDFLDN